jgi:multicomponent Na+:H+ antiporter subunit D
MVGIPVFAGFSAKLFFALAAADADNMKILFLTMVALAVSSVLNALYFIRTLIRIYSSGRGGADISAPQQFAQMHNLESDVPDSRERVETAAEHLEYWIPMLALVAAKLFLGLNSSAVAELIQRGLMMFD